MRRETTLARLAGCASLVGLALTIASIGVVTEVHPGQDGYRGDARLLGYPLPFAYVLSSDDGSEELDNQASCAVSGPWCRYPAPSGRFGTPHFVLDWLAWSTAVACLGPVAWGAWRKRRHPG